MRYIVVDGSDTGHCCFDATVLDTTKPQLSGDGRVLPGRYEQVCECFEREAADMIADALNRLADR